MNVFQALRQTDLMLKLNKCHFAQREVQYFGHIVSAADVHLDPAKSETVSRYPVPNGVKELRQFLGLDKYYCRFIADYCKVAGPHHRLLTKKCIFHWHSKCQDALDELNHRLVNPPITAFPDFNQQFVLYTNASNSAIEGVLSQNQDGKE